MRLLRSKAVLTSFLYLVYRYVPGAIYRPHIDGAWPASGVDPTTVRNEVLISSSPLFESD
jgi:hypothetical protein